MVFVVSILLVAFFLLMNAFFVVAEFSLVRVRKSQIDILLEEGARGAKRAKEISENVNAYLSACQLGITLASLAIGWLGEPAVSSVIHEPLAALGLPMQRFPRSRSPSASSLSRRCTLSLVNWCRNPWPS